MKRAVLVLCAAAAAAAFKDLHRKNRQYLNGDVGPYQGYPPYQNQPLLQVTYQPEVPYQHVSYSDQASGVPYQQTYQYSGDATPNYQYGSVSSGATLYQPQYAQYPPVSNSIDTYQSPYPTQATLQPYGAPLAPYPPQFNAHQQAHYRPPPGYTDLFGPTPPVTPTVVIRKPTSTKAPTTQPPNNIFSLLLSLSQSSSGLSAPRSTKRPAATIATIATAQPAPKAQIYSFAGYPPPLQSQQGYYPQRRLFDTFSLSV